MGSNLGPQTDYTECSLYSWQPMRTSLSVYFQYIIKSQSIITAYITYTVSKVVLNKPEATL
jgi:hypothetical protein